MEIKNLIDMPNEKLKSSIYCIFQFDSEEKICYVKKLKAKTNEGDYKEIVDKIEKLDENKESDYLFSQLNIIFRKYNYNNERLYKKVDSKYYYYLHEKVNIREPFSRS